MEVLGVGTFNLGRDVSDTESSSHSEVRDHSTGEDHGGKPTNQHRPLALDKEYVPVEDPCLPLDPCGHDKDTDDTKGEEGEDDP